MKRRAFVAGLGAVLAAPLAAETQQAGKVARIGVVPGGCSFARGRIDGFGFDGIAIAKNK